MRCAAPLLLLLLACGAPPDPVELPPPSILLVTLDTLSADRIGAYGYAGAGTPTLDRLARQGILFERALATAPITLPSHASILTGVDPPVHGVPDNGLFVLGAEATLVSEVLQSHGWRTGAFVGSYILDSRFGLDQGFEVYSSPRHSALEISLVTERRADAVVDDAVGWFESVEPGERFFAWVHFYDPHAAYEPPEPWASRFEDPYDGEVAFCDAQLARLLRQLERRGLADDLLVVVTADHGESFGEHGEATHGVFVYQATLHVPLLVSGTHVTRLAGTRVSRPVSNVALPATLLALAGLDPAELPALALASLLAGDGTPRTASAEEVIYIESELPYYSYRWRAIRGLLKDRFKLVEGREPALYDIVADPREQNDLALQHPQELAELRGRLTALLELYGSSEEAARDSIDTGEREMLAALGYVPGAVGGDPYDPQLPDPVERVGDMALYNEAVALFEEAVRLRNAPAGSAWQRQQNLDEAQAVLGQAQEQMQRVVAGSPEAMAPLTLLGLVETQLGNADAAVRVLEKLIRLYPGDAVGRHNLALAYFEASRDADGVRALEEAMALEPRQPAYPLRLAAHYADSGDAERAAHWLARARQLAQEGTPLAAEIEALQRSLDELRDAG